MKKTGILGSGVVGMVIADKMLELGYEVMLGSRSTNSEKLKNWQTAKGNKAHIGTFNQAAAYGEILFYCVKGEIALELAKTLDTTNIKGKTFIDITNPLDFSKGIPPFLIPGLNNTNSLGEELQKTLPGANIVKTLNTVSSTIMTANEKPGKNPSMFISGNIEKAKMEAREILNAFGWSDIIDLGDITTARGTEMLLPLWVRTMVVLGHPNFAFTVVK